MHDTSPNHRPQHTQRDVSDPDTAHVLPVSLKKALRTLRRPYAYMRHTLTDAQQSQTGIFLIRNTVDHRVYVGATKHLLRAYRQAHKDLRATAHPSNQLQAFATAHGLGKLHFEALELCPLDELPAAKQRALDRYQACAPAHGFNSLNPAGPAGQKMSPEARARISAGKKGRPIAPRTAEHQEKLAAAHRGRQRSPETRAAIAAATTGKPKRRRSEPSAH